MISREPVSFSKITLLHAVSVTFPDMPLVLLHYTVQSVWSFCYNQLTYIMDRTTRTASGAEDMLLHVAIAAVSGFFIDIKSIRSHYGPGVDTASNGNECQEYFLGVKAAGA